MIVVVLLPIALSNAIVKTCYFDFSVAETSHLYTTFLTQQFPVTEQLFLSLELHGGMDLSFVLVTRLLCILIIWFTFPIQL